MHLTDRTEQPSASASESAYELAKRARSSSRIFEGVDHADPFAEGSSGGQWDG